MNIEELEIGRKYEIHGYKHDGKIHRSWDEAVLLEIHDDYLIFGNETPDAMDDRSCCRIHITLLNI